MPSVASSNPTFIKLRQTLAPSVSCGAAATRPHPRPRAAQLVHSPVAHTHRRAPETVLGLNVSLWAAAVEQRATRLELAASQVPARPWRLTCLQERSGSLVGTRVVRQPLGRLQWTSG